MSELLKVRDVWVGYRGNAVVRSFSIDIAPGGCVALAGKNGSGKSTLLKGIAGLLSLDRGTVTVDGIAIHQMPACERISHVGIMMQDAPVFPRFDIKTNLELGLRSVRSEAERNTRVASILQLSDIFSGREDCLASDLSGGEQQMLSLMRLLLMRPKVLLLDEPSTGLSGRAADAMKVMLNGILEEGHAILMAEQNLDFARSLAGSFITLDTQEDQP